MIPVNEAQQQLQDLLDSVSQSHQPFSDRAIDHDRI
jgi:PHD/YefM family antitoxin component YafN of YafNO toxin-antitoxin module